jgi:phosphoribosylformylglycinamidine (FGAM) synthase-like amidotransferase family enzyme
MGTAVKGYLSVTTASASIPGDDITQVEIEKFVSGQLDAETTMSDLEVNAKIYGHKYTEEGGEVSSSDDVSPNGGYAFIEPILKKDKSIIFRATCLHKVCAMPSSERQEADTKKSGELSPKNNAVSYKVMEDATGAWRTRKDFPQITDAESFIESTFAAAAAQ